MSTLLTVVVSIGLFAVGLCFFILMPFMGQLISSLFGLVMGEQVLARLRGVPSGCDVED